MQFVILAAIIAVVIYVVSYVSSGLSLSEWWRKGKVTAPPRGKTMADQTCEPSRQRYEIPRASRKQQPAPHNEFIASLRNGREVFKDSQEQVVCCALIQKLNAYVNKWIVVDSQSPLLAVQEIESIHAELGPLNNGMINSLERLTMLTSESNLPLTNEERWTAIWTEQDAIEDIFESGMRLLIGVDQLIRLRQQEEVNATYLKTLLR